MAGTPRDRRGDADVSGRGTRKVDAVTAGARDVDRSRRPDGRRRDALAIDGITAGAGDVQSLDVDAVSETDTDARCVRDDWGCRPGGDELVPVDKQAVLLAEQLLGRLQRDTSGVGPRALIQEDVVPGPSESPDPPAAFSAFRLRNGEAERPS